MQCQLMGELVDLALAPAEFPVLGDEQNGYMWVHRSLAVCTFGA